MVVNFKPFAVEEAVGDFILPPEHFVVLAALGKFFDDALVGVKRGLVLVLRLQTTAHEIRRARRVVRQRPDAQDAMRGVERDGEILVGERLLGNLKLFLGARPLPFASLAVVLVIPAFAGNEY